MPSAERKYDMINIKYIILKFVKRRIRRRYYECNFNVIKKYTFSYVRIYKDDIKFLYNKLSHMYKHVCIYIDGIDATDIDNFTFKSCTYFRIVCKNTNIELVIFNNFDGINIVETEYNSINFIKLSGVINFLEKTKNTSVENINNSFEQMFSIFNIMIIIIISMQFFFIKHIAIILFIMLVLFCHTGLFDKCRIMPYNKNIFFVFKEVIAPITIGVFVGIVYTLLVSPESNLNHIANSIVCFIKNIFHTFLTTP